MREAVGGLGTASWTSSIGRGPQRERNPLRPICLTVGGFTPSFIPICLSPSQSQSPDCQPRRQTRNLPKTQPFSTFSSPAALKPGQLCGQYLSSFHATLLGQCHLGHVSPRWKLGGSEGQVAWVPIFSPRLMGSLNLTSLNLCFLICKIKVLLPHLTWLL